MAFSDLSDRALKDVCTALGESVEYRPQSGDPVTIQAVFSKVFQSIDPSTGVPIATDQPNLLLRLADLESEPLASDTVLIGSTVYRVHETQADGEGGAVLLLYKV